MHTLTQFMNEINAALNYPALSYPDISLFLDQAVAELNTTLHTGLRSISECIRLFAKKHVPDAGIVSLGASVPTATFPTSADGSLSGAQEYAHVFSSSASHPREFAYRDGKEIKYSKRLLGIVTYNGQPSYFSAVAYSDSACSWVSCENPHVLDLNEYFDDEWVLLWLIPYVCFKYTVRDGGVASTFAEEMQQGFQQLQDTYDVPESYVLSERAGEFAYDEDLDEHSDDLTTRVKVRALKGYMKHGRSLNAEYGSVYDAGGFGI